MFEGSLRAFMQSTRKMSTFTAGCYPAARRALAAHNQSLELTAKRSFKSVYVIQLNRECLGWSGAATQLYVRCAQEQGLNEICDRSSEMEFIEEYNV